ncbi:MAG: transposase [Patescibacteria group bacterium]|jgi:putative transposase
MPAKNTLKIYADNGYYHLYNRGVERRNIFLCSEDYLTLLHLIKTCLTGNPISPNTSKSLQGRLELLAFCLMPNHFHLLIKQNDKEAMTEFMRKVFTSYSMYFNKKYKRAGTLFESRYKASLIDRPDYLLHLSRYIHHNPANLLRRGQKLEDYPYSSLPNYLGHTNTDWGKTEEILNILKDEFGKRTTYKDFMKDTKIQSPFLAYENLTLEDYS